MTAPNNLRAGPAYNRHMRLLALILFFLIAGSARAADPAALLFQKDIQPLLTTYCYKCHTGDKVKGDISLAPFKNEDAVQSDPKLWRTVLGQLGDYTMPPKTKPQPAPLERQLLIEYITHRLNHLDLSKLPKDPGRVTLHRLNRQEYNFTLRDLLNIDTHPADLFPADGGGGGGFDNNADTLFVPPVLMEMYLKAAGEALAATDMRRLLTSRPDDRKSKRVAARECLDRFITKAFRRPVEPAEVDRFLQLFDQADRRGASFEQSFRLACKAVLISPNFLFRIEKERGVKEPYPISDYELASRLSYFIWASMPDDELFKLAKENKLHEDAVIDQQVRRMLKDPKSRALPEYFGGQWLGFNALQTTAAPDRVKFPKYTSELRDSYYNQAFEFVDSIFREDRSVLTLIDSDYTYLNEPIARLYGIPKISGEELRRVALVDAGAKPANTKPAAPGASPQKSLAVSPTNRRGMENPAPSPAVHGGVLGLSAIHVITSYPLRTSPVLRGRWVLETLLGAPPPPPPPDVPKLPDDDAITAGLSLRQRLEKHRSDPNCASCHARMDPIGFGLENFDPIGRWRTQISGQPVDSAGKLTTGETFSGPIELKQLLLKRKDDFTRTLASKMLSYALGRGLEFYDEPAVAVITADLAKNDYKSTEMIAAIAKSYPFRYRRD